MVQYRKATVYIIITSFISPTYTFPWPETIVYTPNGGVKGEKYHNNIVYQRKRCRLWREINTLPSTSSLTNRVLSILRRTNTGPVRRKWTSKWLFPHGHIK